MSATAGNSIQVCINGQELILPAALSVRQLLQQLNLPQQGVAVEVNGCIVPKSQWDTFYLQNGARLELVHMVGGGV